VDEEAWLNSTDPGPMLEYLGDKADQRKLRSLACAFARRIWPLLCNDRSREAVRVAEAFADGLASAEALTEASFLAHEAWQQAEQAMDRSEDAPMAALLATSSGVDGRAAQTAGFAAQAAAAAGAAWNTEREAQADLVRCIFGNQFRPAPPLNPAVLQWNDGTVPNRAQAIYYGRAFDRLPCLAHALEEARCADAAILGHCRDKDRPHARGCFVLDLILRPRPPAPTEETASA
jgi:hypothetical protein